MADGTSYTIDVQAKSMGVDATAAQVLSLADSIQNAGAVCTQFDNAVAASQAQMKSAAAAAFDAAEAYEKQKDKLKQAEVASVRASKDVEKALASGKDTSALQATADAAKAKVLEEAAALDQLKAKMREAADAEKKMAAAAKTVEEAQKKAADEVKKGFDVGKAGGAFGKLGGPLGAIGQKLMDMKEGSQQMEEAFGPTLGKIVSGATMAASAVAGIGVAVVAVIAVIGALAIAGAVAFYKFASLAVTTNKDAMAKITKAQEKAKDNFAKLFSGVHVDKFVSAFEDVLSVLDEGSSTSKALTALFSAMLNPFFDAAKQVAPYVKEMFKGLVWGALEGAVAVVKLRNAILKAIPKETRDEVRAFVASISTMENAFYAGAAVVGVLAVSLGVLTVVCGALAALIGVVLVGSFMILAAPILSTVAIFGLIVGAIGALCIAVVQAVDYLAELAGAGSGVASNLIAGLVGGITSGAGMFVDALKNLASSGIAAMKNALGIHSPSKFAMEMASNVTSTFSDTIDKGSGDVNESMSSLVEAPKPTGFSDLEAMRSDSSTTNTTTHGGNVINITINAPTGDAADICSKVEECLAELFEGSAIMVGAT